MTIKKQIPVAMTEVQQLIEESGIENQDLQEFIKKFIILKEKEAVHLLNELKEIQLAKMKEKEIVKIIDFLPEDAADLQKIFTDVGLDEDEQQKILAAIKKYK